MKNETAGNKSTPKKNIKTSENKECRCCYITNPCETNYQHAWVPISYQC
jgi:hypothetical protein